MAQNLWKGSSSGKKQCGTDVVNRHFHVLENNGSLTLSIFAGKWETRIMEEDVMFRNWQSKCLVAFGGGLIQESIATFLPGERNNDGNAARAAVASSLGTIF
jgi:hypothetical protein